MSRFQDYMALTSTELRHDFEKIRAMSTDPGIKGGKNEATIATFVKSHCFATSVAQKMQVIDAGDKISDELDVVASNEFQPFGTPEECLCLIEGVSFVIQVKAILTRDELRRSVQNCISFKRLVPWFGKGDIVYREFYGLRPHYLAPYICFCYTSELKDTTILKELTAASAVVTADQQIDAVFVLDRGYSILNFKGGSAKFTNSSGNPIVGWGLTYTADDTLLEMLSFIHLTVPRIMRVNSPIQGYTEAALGQPRKGLFHYAPTTGVDNAPVEKDC